MDLRNSAEHKCAIAVPNEGCLGPAMIVQDVSYGHGHVVGAQRLPGEAYADMATLQQHYRPGAEGKCDLMYKLKVRRLQASQHLFPTGGAKLHSRARFKCSELFCC